MIEVVVYNKLKSEKYGWLTPYDFLQTEWSGYIFFLHTLESIFAYLIFKTKIVFKGLICCSIIYTYSRKI